MTPNDFELLLLLLSHPTLTTEEARHLVAAKHAAEFAPQADRSEVTFDEGPALPPGRLDESRSP